MLRIGLAEWDKLEDMIALTQQYMTHGEMNKPKRTIAQLLRTLAPVVENDKKTALVKVVTADHFLGSS